MVYGKNGVGPLFWIGFFGTILGILTSAIWFGKVGFVITGFWIAYFVAVYFWGEGRVNKQIKSSLNGGLGATG